MEPRWSRGARGARCDRLERFFLIGVRDLSQKTSCAVTSHCRLENPKEGPYWCFKKIGGGGGIQAIDSPP